MLISRQAINDYLEREFDDFRWMKKLRREQLEAEFKRLKVPPIFKTESWLHQMVCFWVGLHMPRFLFLLDMGAGKTKILSDIMTQVQRERKLEGALVFVPRMTNIDSWIESLEEHSNLEPWAVSCSDTEEKWERLAYPKGDVTIIDYAGFHRAVCKKEKKKKGFVLVRDDKKIKFLQRQYNFIGLDESHKVGNHDNLWHGLIWQMTKETEFCYATTGTLFGKNLESMWSQFKLVDGGETFGENLGLFRASLFSSKMHQWKGNTFEFNPRMKNQLHLMLQHRSLRYDEDEMHDLPKCVSREVKCLMSDEQREHYLRALEGLINADGNLKDLDGAWIRMRQITSGFLAWKDGHGDHIIHFKENPKLDALERLLDEMGDSKIIVCYDYTETGRLIVERVKALELGYEWFYGGTKDKSASRRRFLDDPDCRVFVMNSEAGGTGNDGLQKVARYMVFYESPCSPITRKQTQKRIHRPGQLQRSFIYDLVMRRSQDRKILDSIKEGVDLYTNIVNGRAKNKNIFLMD